MALELLRQHDFDAIVLDLRLPDMSGFGLLKQLRDHFVELPTLILSGIGDAESRLYVTELGGDAYLEKPCDPETLKQTLMEIIKKHQRPGTPTNNP